MKDFLINLIKLLICITLLVFGEEYLIKLLGSINFTLSSSIIHLIYYSLLSICVFIVYRSDILSDLNKYKKKGIKNLIYSLIVFLILLMVTLIVDYICRYISKFYDIKYIGMDFINIFHKTLDGKLILSIIQNMLLIPFIKITIFTMGVDNLFSQKSSYMICGLSYGIFNSLLLGGTIGYKVVNSMLSVIIFGILAYVYEKNNNLFISLVTYILFLMFAESIYLRIL